MDPDSSWSSSNSVSSLGRNLTAPRTPRSLHRLRGAPAAGKDLAPSAAPKFANAGDSPSDIPKWYAIQQKRAARGEKVVKPLEEIVKEGVREILVEAEGSFRNPTLDRDRRLLSTVKRPKGKGGSIEEELNKLEHDKANGFSRSNLLDKEGSASTHKLSQLSISHSRQLHSSFSLRDSRQRSATESSGKLSLSNSALSLANKKESRWRSKTEEDTKSSDDESADMRGLTPSQSARQLNLRGDRKVETQNLEPFMKSKSSALVGSTEYFAPLRGPAKLPPVTREEQRQWDRAYRKGGDTRRHINPGDFDPYSGRPLRSMDLNALPNDTTRSPLDGFPIFSSQSMDTIKSPGYKRSDFEFIECIGRGSCARVMLATPTLATRSSDRRPFAVKVMNKCDLAKIPGGAESALNERNILRTISHPFIIPYVDSFQDNACLYLVMEYMPFNLRALLDREKKLQEEAARFYIAEASCAIDWLHSRGVIYRDLKPDNILIDLEGHIKICDFGAADRKVEDGSNAFIGTGVYMAPEVVLGCLYYKSVDWWGIGSLVYELLAGQAPFAKFPGSGASIGARSDPETFLNILDGALYLPKTIFSENASDLITKLMCRQPEKRLGAKGGIQELRCHPWFKTILSWIKIEEGEATPPFYPTDLKKIKAVEPTDILDGGEMGWSLGNGKFRTDGEVGALRDVPGVEADHGDWDKRMEFQIYESSATGSLVGLFQLY
ncbi:hypothetical protein HDU97_009165 [Phlyctochytrium planicorne]|nr:hypothetical protein HDU97_009165 [Phlyctochytrium planicorne]